MKPKLTIYVVDDDPAIVGALASLIGVIGFDVETFESAEAFLKAYEDHGPACLILDIRLPGMSGLELQKELLRRGLRVPIIFITGHAEMDTADKALRLGAVGFLEKPFQTRELFDSIQRVISPNDGSSPYQLH